MNSLEGLTNLANLILEGIGKRKRLIAILFFGGMVLLTFLYFESHTRLVYYYSLERKISLLDQLNKLAENNVTGNKDLNPIYSEISSEVLNRKVTPMELPTITTLVLYKFLTGATFGLLFLFIGLFSKRPKAMQGALLVALFFGIVAIFVPVLGSLWINLIVLMVGQLFLLVSLAPNKNSHNTPRAV